MRRRDEVRSIGRVGSLLAPVVLAACMVGGSGDGPPDGGAAPGQPRGTNTPAGVAASCGPPGSTADVYSRLAPTCSGCHGVGSSRPFFASAAAFESTIAYDPAYVTRGDPDASVLVHLLEARATGTYRQMPLGGSDFATLTGAGQTRITIAEVRAWIATLPPPPAALEGPDPTAATTRRLSADEYVRAVGVALGQDAADSVPPLLSVGAGSVSALSPDSPVTVYAGEIHTQLYAMLGGPGYLAQRAAETAWSTSSLTAVTQLAQGVCAQAVRARNPQVFHSVRPGARLATDAAAIRANVAYLYQRFLGAPPRAADVDAYVTAVYAPAEAASPDAAWTQVCAALLRDPLFLTY